MFLLGFKTNERGFFEGVCGLIWGRYFVRLQMSSPKPIHEITIEDLQSHRWCLYHNDELGFDGFEYAIPDSHPEFTEAVIEIELCEFTFANGKKLLGIYDGAKNFTIDISGEFYSLWYGVMQPTSNDLARFKSALITSDLLLPVIAYSVWSGTQAIFSGIQYVDSSGKVEEASI